jgi:anti-anti-sigma factor
VSRELSWASLSFSVSIEHEPGRLVVRPRGELDIASAPALEQTLADAMASAAEDVPIKVVRFELAGLEFVDVAGARAIGRCAALARANGLDFVAVGASRQARFVFEHCGLTDYTQLQ